MEQTQKPIGEVFIYFAKIGVAALKLTGTMKKGDIIHIKGATTDFTQKVDSMQIDKSSVNESGPGTEVGIKVKDKVRPGDKIYKA